MLPIALSWRFSLPQSLGLGPAHNFPIKLFFFTSTSSPPHTEEFGIQSLPPPARRSPQYCSKGAFFLCLLPLDCSLEGSCRPSGMFYYAESILKLHRLHSNIRFQKAFSSRRFEQCRIWPLRMTRVQDNVIPRISI